MKKYSLKFLGALALGLSVTLSAFGECKAPVCKNDTLRILSIGNSFSEDAFEQEFIPLCKSAGVNVVVGNMYIGGCDINRHFDNFKKRQKKTTAIANLTHRANATPQTTTVSALRSSMSLGI